MSRKKASAAAAARQPDRDASSVSPKAALIEALFQQSTSDPCPKDDPAVLTQKAAVHKAWTRTCMLALHERTQRERAFVSSRDEAICALRRIAPVFSAIAEHPSASLCDPPVHRRMPSLTPPDPAKLPYAMARADAVGCSK